MRLVLADKTHFPENDVIDIVSSILRALLVHCCDVDADWDLRFHAHNLIQSYGLTGLPFVCKLPRATEVPATLRKRSPAKC